MEDRTKIEEFVVCECGCINHFLFFNIKYDKWSDKKFIDFSANFYLNPRKSFFGRLWAAFKYVIGYRYVNCFDEVIIAKENAEKIINIMQTYLDLKKQINASK